MKWCPVINQACPLLATCSVKINGSMIELKCSNGDPDEIHIIVTAKIK